MNKTILIAGGASVASLAVGGATGYFIAKKQIDANTAAAVDAEVEKTRDYFFAVIAKHKETIERLESDLADITDESGKSNPEDIPHQDTAEGPDGETAEEELSETEQEVVDKARLKLKQNGQGALKDYQGISTGKIVSGGPEKPKLSTLVQKNIFDAPEAPDENVTTKSPPLRGEGGRFIPKHAVPAQSSEPDEGDGPFTISPEDFLLNEPENDQESLYYYVKDNTVTTVADLNDVIEVEKVGAVNLARLARDEESSAIYVRNNRLGVDYQITLTHDSLTKAMGFGDDDESESELDEYAGQD